MIWAEYTLIHLHTNEENGGVQREVSFLVRKSPYETEYTFVNVLFGFDM